MSHKQLNITPSVSYILAQELYTNIHTAFKRLALRYTSYSTI